MFGMCFVMQYLLPFLSFSYHLAEEERAGCFVRFPCLFLTVLSVGLLSVIVPFPGHTHLFFYICMLNVCCWQKMKPILQLHFHGLTLCLLGSQAAVFFLNQLF